MIGNFSVTDFSLWLYFLYFTLVLFIANYIPGSLLLKKLKQDTFSKIVLSLIVGMVLWGYQGYIFGYLDFRSGTYIYLGICFLLWILQKPKFSLKIQKIKDKQEVALFAILITSGTFVQLVSIWYHGVSIPQGLYFCCGIDSLYHHVLTQQLVKQFPPLEPGTFNTVVENYHYFSNMIVAEWVRVFNLPLTATYFQFSTVALSLLMGASAVTFGKILSLGKKYICWLLFFIYFSGSATYLIILASRHIFDFHSIILIDATILWASPPRVYALVVFLAALSFLQLWLKSKQIYWGVLSGVLFGCLISIKVYFGLFVLAGFFTLNTYFLFKRNFKAVLPSLITILFSLLLYLPVNKESGGLFFVGMWRFENFIVYEPLGLLSLELARTTALGQGNWIRVVFYEAVFVAFYFIATFGTLLIAFVQHVSSLAKIRRELHFFLLGGILISLSAGMFFIQDTGGANSSQFIITVIAIIAIYAALAADFWTSKLKNKVLVVIFALIIILLTIPRAINDTVTKLYAISHLSDVLITNEELQALRFLQKAPDGIILTTVNDCLHIPLLTNKAVYACNDAGVLTDHKVKKGNERIEDAKKLFADIGTSQTRLQSHGIKYIYIKKPGKQTAYPLKTIFENSAVIILEVSSASQ